MAGKREKSEDRQIEAIYRKHCQTEETIAPAMVEFVKASAL